jgi:hypothetical protein
MAPRFPSGFDGSGELGMFLTAAEVGAILHLKKSRVYQLAAAGMLPNVRLSPRKILFSRRGLEALDQAAIDRVLSVRAS